MKIKNVIFFIFFSIFCLSISINAFSQSGQKWSLGGNSIGSSDFFGTTNSQPLTFKTNGNVWMTLDINGGLALKSFSGTGSGILTYNIDGKLIMLPFSGNSNLILTGSGYFSDISEISGWRLNNGDLVNTNQGNVGIGTLAPQTKLHVVGDAIITGTVFTSHVMITDKINSVKMLSDSNFSKSAAVEDYLKIGGGSNPPIPPTPGVSLEVYGNVLAAGTITSNTLKATNLQIMGGITQFDNLHVMNRAEIGNSIFIEGFNNAGLLNHIYTDNTGNPTLFLQSQNSPINFNTVINANNDGKVGIGINSPSEKLHVLGNARFGQESGYVVAGYNHVSPIIDSYGGTNPYLLLNYYSGQDVYIATNKDPDGNGTGSLYVGRGVGIGGVYDFKAPVNASNPAKIGLYIYHDNDPLSDGHPNGIRIEQKNINNNNWFHWDILNDGNLYFTRTEYTNAAMMITTSDNVGIGTRNPGSKLQVLGDARFGNQNDFITVNHNTHDAIIDNFGTGNLLINYNSGKNTIVGGLTGGDFYTNNNTYLAVNNGKVCIGTTEPGRFTLAVEGVIGAREIELTDIYPFPDYVFKSDYSLMPLSDLEKYVKTNSHLPGVPSEDEVKENGLPIGEFNTVLLTKIEELTLYLIQLKKENDEMKKEIQDLKSK